MRRKGIVVFENILGQPLVKSIIKKWVDRDRWPNAVLMHGPAKVGKWSAALNTAMLINCNGQKTSICMCSSCKKIRQKCHPDVYFLEPNDKDNITIDQVRELGENLSYVVSEGKRKVALVKDSHKLLPGAANALLKILEEPRGDTTLILTTSHFDQLLDTIKSRCHLLRFSYLADLDISNLLQRDGFNDDPVIVGLMGGSYSMDQTKDNLIVFKKLWDGGELISLDEQGGEALRGELIYLAGCIVHMYKKGLVEFNEIKITRLNGDKVDRFVLAVEEAVSLYDAKVRPFLVAKVFERHVKEILS